MKLESFGISNFKAFGASLQRMPLKPITLIFGPNSAGKSSAIHSLLWLSHLNQTGELDVRHPATAAGKVDLGGFRQFTYRNDPANRLRSSLTIARPDLPKPLVDQFGIKEEITYEFTCAVITNEKQLEDHVDLAVEAARAERAAKRAQLSNEGSPPDPLHELIDPWILTDLKERLLADLRYRFFRGDSAPYIHTVSIMVDGNEVLRATAKKPGPLSITILDLDFLSRPSRYLAKALDFALGKGPSVEGPLEGNLEDAVTRGLIFLSSFDCQLPNQLQLHDEFERKQTSPSSIAPPNEELAGQLRKQLAPLSKLLSMVIATAAKESAEMVHVPPLRELPERFSVGSLDGSAWKRLKVDPDIRAKVNIWLTSDFLQTGYEFRTDSLVSLGTVRDTLIAELEDLVQRKNQEFQEGADAWQDGEEDDPYEAFQKPVRDWDGEAEGKRIFQQIHSKSAPGAIEELALFDKRAGIQVSLKDVGVGISQLLPVLVESFGNRDKLIAIEQPEIHIHPALQAELADVFIESALGENKNTFLLETHSEHLILRLLRRIRETTRGKLPEGCIPIKPSDISVLYVEPGEEGSTIRELRVNDQGRFIDSWPNGFFEERFNEEF